MGTRIINFTIQKRSFDDLTITVADDLSEAPAVSLKFGDTELVKDTDYTVTYTLRPDGKQVIVTVEGIGNFEGIYSVFKPVGEDPSGGGGDTPGSDTPGNDTPGDDTSGDDTTGGDPSGGDDPANHLVWIIPTAIVGVIGLAFLALFLLRKKLGYVPLLDKFFGKFFGKHEEPALPDESGLSPEETHAEQPEAAEAAEAAEATETTETTETNETTENSDTEKS